MTTPNPDDGFQEFLTEAKQLSSDVQGLKRQLRINRTWRNILTALVAAMVVMVVVLVITIVRLKDTQHREQVTRSQVLCPLYSLFVQSVDAPKSPVETTQQYQQRLAARPLIHDSYKKLGCQP